MLNCWKSKTIVSGSAGVMYMVMSAAGLLALCGNGSADRCIKNLAIVSIMMLISCRDMQYRVIPNRCVAAGLLLCGCFTITKFRREGLYAAWRSWAAGVLTGIILVLVCLCISFLLRCLKDADYLGGGDLKLLFLGSVILGPKQTLVMLLAACILGLVTAWIFHARGQKIFPFGPAIAAAIAGLVCFPFP